MCRLCEEEEETFIHILNECPRLNDTRKNIFKDKMYFNEYLWSIKQLLEFMDTPNMNCMLTSKDDLPMKDIQYIHHEYSIDSSDEYA